MTIGRKDHAECLMDNQDQFFFYANSHLRRVDFILVHISQWGEIRMAHYMKVSTEIYQVYLKYIAPEDIHVYSIDEVFMDVTNYLATYGLSPRQLAMKMILDVLEDRKSVV